MWERGTRPICQHAGPSSFPSAASLALAGLQADMEVLDAPTSAMWDEGDGGGARLRLPVSAEGDDAAAELAGAISRAARPHVFTRGLPAPMRRELVSQGLLPEGPGHGGSLRRPSGIALSPDGTRLLVTSYDLGLAVVAGPEERRELPGQLLSLLPVHSLGQLQAAAAGGAAAAAGGGLGCAPRPSCEAEPVRPYRDRERDRVAGRGGGDLRLLAWDVRAVPRHVPFPGPPPGQGPDRRCARGRRTWESGPSEGRALGPLPPASGAAPCAVCAQRSGADAECPLQGFTPAPLLHPPAVPSVGWCRNTRTPRAPWPARWTAGAASRSLRWVAGQRAGRALGGCAWRRPGAPRSTGRTPTRWWFAEGPGKGEGGGLAEWVDGGEAADLKTAAWKRSVSAGDAAVACCVVQVAGVTSAIAALCA
jgi:hypothetical protein